jgi:hypothetical protein
MLSLQWAAKHRPLRVKRAMLSGMASAFGRRHPRWHCPTPAQKSPQPADLDAAKFPAAQARILRAMDLATCKAWSVQHFVTPLQMQHARFPPLEEVEKIVTLAGAAGAWCWYFCWYIEKHDKQTPVTARLPAVYSIESNEKQMSHTLHSLARTTDRKSVV